MSIMYCSAAPSSRTTPPHCPVWKQSRHNKEKKNTKGEAVKQRKNKKAISFHALSEMGCLDRTVAFYTAWVCSTGLVLWIILNHSVCIQKWKKKKKPTLVFCHVCWICYLSCGRLDLWKQEFILPHNADPETSNMTQTVWASYCVDLLYIWEFTLRE